MKKNKKKRSAKGFPVRKPDKKGLTVIRFDKMLDELSVYFGPVAVWAGFLSRTEIIVVAVCGFILCKAWAAKIRAQQQKELT